MRFRSKIIRISKLVTDVKRFKNQTRNNSCAKCIFACPTSRQLNTFVKNRTRPASDCRLCLVDSINLYLCPSTCVFPLLTQRNNPKMSAEPPSLTSQSALLHARAKSAITALQTMLTCPSCSRPYGLGRPYRSTRCEHTLCAGCAAVARGQLGEHANPSPAVVAASGHCPVRACQIPVRPAELCEDVSVASVVCACSALADWAGAVAKERGGGEL